MIFFRKRREAVALTIATACNHLGIARSSVNVDIHFTSGRAIKRLNALHRGVDKCTDVLSFPNLEINAGELPTVEKFAIDVNPETGLLELGTIFICERVARKQARKLGHSLLREVCFLALHGFLHLLGYDHKTDEEEATMIAVQQEIMQKLGVK